MNEISLISDVLDKEGPFESILCCTFGLDLHFLENYLLNIRAFHGCDDIMIFTDGATYEGLIKDNPLHINRRYHVFPLFARNVFHTKIYYFLSENKSVAIVGSANATRDGFASNLELVSVMKCDKDNQQYNPVMQQISEYFVRLSQLTQSPFAKSNVDTAITIHPQYLPIKRDNNTISLIHNLDAPILETLAASLKDEHIINVDVISPFFDSELRAISRIHQAFPKSKISITLQQYKTTFPKDNYNSVSNESIYLVKGINRFIHGKALIFHSESKTYIYMGSANCTAAALLHKAESSNYEAGLFGEISATEAASISKLPEGSKSLLTSLEDLQVTHIEDQPKILDSVVIPFLVQIELKNDTLTVLMRADYANFHPKNLVFINSTMNPVTVPMPDSLNQTFSLEKPDLMNNYQSAICAYIEGSKDDGTPCRSNSAWIIKIYEGSQSDYHQKYRMIYSDPSIIPEFLSKMLAENNTEEYLKFLLLFDVPLDLLLPHHMVAGFLARESKGNIEGSLSQSTSSQWLTQDYTDALKGFFERTLKKLQKHAENPQYLKIGNFVLILSIIYSMIEFINTAVGAPYTKKKVLTPKEWYSIREYYNLLFSYIECTYQIIWNKYSYSDLISDQLITSNDDIIDEGITTFEKYIVYLGYTTEFQEIGRIATSVLSVFNEIMSNSTIDTGIDKTIAPRLFPTSFMILQRKETIVKVLTESVQRLQ